jgi:hypothetical protein
MKYYHMSKYPLKVGDILIPNPKYEYEWSGNPWYRALEFFRPKKFLAHKDSIFMCDNEDDVEIASGAENDGETGFLVLVKPIGKVDKHDLNFGSLVQCLISEVDGIFTEEVDDKIEEACNKYWNSEASDDPCWEYLCKSAKVVKVLY